MLSIKATMSDRASTEKLFNRNIETTTNSVARGADENKAGYTAADASGSAFSLIPATRLCACVYMTQSKLRPTFEFQGTLGQSFFN